MKLLAWEAGVQLDLGDAGEAFATRTTVIEFGR
jgi:hypothetical protein